eukprot:3438815-Ditylum_brightwellii.AAC.1
MFGTLPAHGTQLDDEYEEQVLLNDEEEEQTEDFKDDSGIITRKGQVGKIKAASNPAQASKSTKMEIKLITQEEPMQETSVQVKI